MAAGTVDVGLRDGAHPELVEGPGEEGGERGDEGNGPTAAPGADRHTDQVLLSDEALDVVLRARLTETKWKRGGGGG